MDPRSVRPNDARRIARGRRTLRFPPGLVRQPTSDCDGWDACAHSPLAPHELGPKLAAMFDDGHAYLLPTLRGSGCLRFAIYGLQVLGHFDGYDVMAQAEWNLVQPPRGSRPPEGAINYRNLGRYFLAGTNVLVLISQERADPIPHAIGPATVVAG